jgi:ParB-like chromosome segregation protein Spo0J
VLVGALVVVTQGIVGQGRELRAAATEDIDAYVAANEVANDLSDLRVVEIEAVAARGSGAERYDSFTEAASELRTAVNDAPGDRDDIAALAGDLRSYVAAVDGDQGVRVLDLDEGDNQAAADATLTGPSFQAFSAADDQATANVQREDAELADRFAAAGDADVAPLLPLVLGIVAGGLAAAGILARGRRYR